MSSVPCRMTWRAYFATSGVIASEKGHDKIVSSEGIDSLAIMQKPDGTKIGYRLVISVRKYCQPMGKTYEYAHLPENIHRDEPGRREMLARA